MNHEKASSFPILQMRDVCCQLSWFGYKSCHFSLKLGITRRRDCVIEVLHVPISSSLPPGRHRVMGEQEPGKGLCVRNSQMGL